MAEGRDPTPPPDSPESKPHRKKKLSDSFLKRATHGREDPPTATEGREEEKIPREEDDVYVNARTRVRRRALVAKVLEGFPEVLEMFPDLEVVYVGEGEDEEDIATFRWRNRVAGYEAETARRSVDEWWNVYPDLRQKWVAVRDGVPVCPADSLDGVTKAYEEKYGEETRYMIFIGEQEPADAPSVFSPRRSTAERKDL